MLYFNLCGIAVALLGYCLLLLLLLTVNSWATYCELTVNKPSISETPELLTVNLLWTNLLSLKLQSYLLWTQLLLLLLLDTYFELFTVMMNLWWWICDDVVDMLSTTVCWKGTFCAFFVWIVYRYLSMSAYYSRNVDWFLFRWEIGTPR
jgi:hypothetical protein